MKSKNIIIKKKEGEVFSKKSGDRNKIHLNFLTGYNSQFGENIVHGSLVLIKFLKIFNFEHVNSIKINFFNGFLYESLIKIENTKSNKNNDIYRLIQNNEEKAVINISKKKIGIISKIEKKTYYKKFTINKKIKKLFLDKQIDNELNLALNYLTKYVGMIYPGEHSLISEINIENKIFSKFNNVEIYSYKPSSRHPIIYNNLYYKKFEISFQTLVRPKLIIKNNKKNIKLSKYIKDINKNIFIIGASNGIGLELFNLFKDNFKKKLICSYNHNEIKLKKKNIIIKKIDIEKDLDVIFSTIKKYKPSIVYYFPTPKINLNANTNKQLKVYKKFYTTIPIKIIKFCILHKSFFFYPSSTFIDKGDSNYYTLFKKHAENQIFQIKFNKVYVNILRIPEINTKQNLTIFDKNLPSFTKLINMNKNFKEKIFFKNLI